MSTTRSKAFAANVSWSALLQLVIIISGLIIPRTIIQSYGSSTNGLVASLSQFIGYFALAEAGLTAAATFALYAPLAQKNWRRINAILSATSKLYKKSGHVFLALVALLALTYPLIIDTEGFSGLQLGILVFALGAQGFFDFYTLARYRVFLTANQKTWVIQCATVVYKITQVIVIVVLASLQVSIELIYVAVIFPIFLRTLIIQGYTRHTYPQLAFSSEGSACETKSPDKLNQSGLNSPYFDHQTLKHSNHHSTCVDQPYLKRQTPQPSALKRTRTKNTKSEKTNAYEIEQRWDAFYTKTLNVIQSSSLLIIATFLLQDLTLVSVFSLYLLISNGLSNLLNAFIQGTPSFFGEMIARQEDEKLARIHREFQTLFYMALSVCCAVGLALIMPFMQLYTAGIADVNYLYPLVGFLVMMNLFLHHLKSPQAIFIDAGGHFKDTKVRATIEAVLIVVCSVVGGIVAGMPGIVAGSCLASLYRIIDFLWYIPSRHPSIRTSTMAKGMVLSLAVCAISLFLITAMNIPITNWLEWAGSAILFIFVSAGVALVVGLLFQRPQVLSLFARLKNLSSLRK